MMSTELIINDSVLCTYAGLIRKSARYVSNYEHVWLSDLNL